MKERNLKIAIPLLVLLFIILGHVKNLSAEVKVPKNPKSAKGCAICHYRWIDTFFIEGKGTDLVPYNSEKQAATKEMCYSCHDGSVADSRSLISNKPIHWSNMQVNTDMQIPKYFSLGEKREFLCATCHTPHALPSGTGTQGSIAGTTSISASSCPTPRGSPSTETRPSSRRARPTSGPPDWLAVRP